MQRAAPDTAIKASLTALSVAQGFTRALALDYGYLFSHQELELSRHLCNRGRQAGIPEEYVKLLNAPYPQQRSFFNKNIIPAYDQIVMLRKLMIKSKIAEAERNGVEQIIFLGGGYDIRAFMTAMTMRNVTVYELDRGPTRTNKLAGIRSIPTVFEFGELNSKLLTDGTLSINDKLFFIECDFITDNLAEKLKEHQFQADKKTLIIAEGLTAYLNQEENEKLLSALRTLMKDTDELLISYITQGEKSKVFEDVLKSANEEHRLALSPNDLIPFADRSGFAISHQFDATRLLDRIGDAEDDATYKEKSNLPKEYYVCMGKTGPKYHAIHDVPFFVFPIEDKNAKLTVKNCP